MKDQAKEKAKVLRQLELIEKGKREAEVVNIVDEQKKFMKRISAKHYREMSYCFKKEKILCVCMRSI